MINARINIKDETNRLINIVKAKYNLKDKSKAIDKFFEMNKDIIDNDWELKKEYIKKIDKIEKNFKKNPGKTYFSIKELRKEIEGA